MRDAPLRVAEQKRPDVSLPGLWLLSALVAVYLIVIGLTGAAVGLLFWPAVATRSDEGDGANWPNDGLDFGISV